MSNLQEAVQGNQNLQSMSETRRYSAAILAEMTSCVVHLVSGKTMSFDVASAATVWHLKKMIKKTIDVPKRCCRVLDGTRELSNHSPLSGSHQLTLVIVDATCTVCNAETSITPRVCGGCYGAFYCCSRARSTVPPWISL